MAKQNILNKSKLQKAQKAIKAGKLTNAIKILSQLCNREPNNIETWLLLATVHASTKNYHEVAECCYKAIALNPQNTAALNYLGSACEATKQHDKAIACYNKSLALKPDDIAVLNSLAAIHYFLGHIDDALVLLHKAIGFKPDHIGSLINIIQICMTQGFNPVAIKHCLTLYKLQPDNLKILTALGQCYINTRQTELAKEVLLKCVELNKKPAELFVMLAENELHNNQTDHLEKSANYLSLALEADPAFLEAKIEQCKVWYRQRDYDKAHKHIKTLIKEGHINAHILQIYSAFCHHFDDCDFVLNESEKLLKQNNRLPNEDKIPLHFSLGRIYDKNKQYKQAFKHYQSGNEAHHIVYKGELNEDYTKDVINIFSSDNLQKLQYASLKSELPVFIIGMPRSGTTLVEQILASHHQVHGAGELRDIHNIYDSFIPTEFGYTEEYPAYTDKLTTEQLNITAQHYIDKLKSHSTTALRVTDKMPQNYLQLGLISQLFPQAKIIHCTRHPLDTILSIYFQDFNKTHNYSFELKNIYHYYQEYQALMQHWKNTLNIPILDVSYTSMVDDFESTCKGLVDFIGLEWDEQCLHFHQSKRTVTTASYDQVRSPIYRSSLDRWKHYEEFLEPLKPICPNFFK